MTIKRERRHIAGGGGSTGAATARGRGSGRAIGSTARREEPVRGLWRGQAAPPTLTEISRAWTALSIPFCYRIGMSQQIAVRLPDELVAFVDEVVGSGRERSRAAVVTKALERERRRAIAQRDAEILAAAAEHDDLGELARWARTRRAD